VWPRSQNGSVKLPISKSCVEIPTYAHMEVRRLVLLKNIIFLYFNLAQYVKKGKFVPLQA
jgi:hypothetical protein